MDQIKKFYKNKKILVTGATGGVGSMAVMILSKFGYNVTAMTGKEDKSDYLKKLGAKNINAYNKESYNLSYPIQKSTNVKFIEFSFDFAPQALDIFTRKLRLDESLLRFFLTKVK